MNDRGTVKLLRNNCTLQFIVINVSYPFIAFPFSEIVPSGQHVLLQLNNAIMSQIAFDYMYLLCIYFMYRCVVPTRTVVTSQHLNKAKKRYEEFILNN